MVEQSENRVEEEEESKRLSRAVLTYCFLCCIYLLPFGEVLGIIFPNNLLIFLWDIVFPLANLVAASFSWWLLTRVFNSTYIVIWNVNLIDHYWSFWSIGNFPKFFFGICFWNLGFNLFLVPSLFSCLDLFYFLMSLHNPVPLLNQMLIGIWTEWVCGCYFILFLQFVSLFIFLFIWDLFDLFIFLINCALGLIGVFLFAPFPKTHSPA